MDCLDAPIKVIRWMGNEWFSYRNRPILYYLSDDDSPSQGKLETTAEEFIAECKKQRTTSSYRKKVENQVVDDNSLEANNLPPMNGDGKRKVQMDKNLKTWLIEKDGTKREIS